MIDNTSTSGMFDGIEKAEIFERGNYAKPGFVGVVQIVRTIAKDALKAGLSFIVEMKVLQTNLPADHPVGSKITWFQKMTDKTVAFPAVKAWAAACVGLLPHQKAEIETQVNPIIKDLMNEAVKTPDDNDFVGQRLLLKTTQIKTQKGLDFTRYDFGPYDGEVK